MKQFLRNALGVAVTALAVVSPLSATTGDGHFQLLTKAAPNDWFNRTGAFTASYTAITLPTNTAFSVFCVDRLGSIGVGSNYDAWVTEISSAQIAAAATAGRTGITSADAFQIYRRQAYLVQTYYALGGNTGLTGSENDWQWAVWGLSELGLGSTQTSFQTRFGVTQGNAAWSIITSTGALNAGLVFDATDWRVISDAARDCSFNGTADRCQEVIFKSGSPPQEIVPEPATMSLLAMGLAGMAGAGLRRRKQAKK